MLMAVATTSYSTALLSAKSILLILHLEHGDFYKHFCKKVLRANGGFFLGILLKKLLKLVR